MYLFLYFVLCANGNTNVCLLLFMYPVFMYYVSVCVRFCIGAAKRNNHNRNWGTIEVRVNAKEGNTGCFSFVYASPTCLRAVGLLCVDFLLASFLCASFSPYIHLFTANDNLNPFILQIEVDIVNNKTVSYTALYLQSTAHTYTHTYIRVNAAAKLSLHTVGRQLKYVLGYYSWTQGKKYLFDFLLLFSFFALFSKLHTASE